MLHVAHRTVQVHRVERRFLLDVEARHDHAGDPEEENLRRGDEDIGRVERLQVIRVIRPAERRKWPEPAREPSVEDVGILMELRRGAFVARRGILAIRFFKAAPVAAPDRNTVAPPQLSRDVPVADAGEPVHVDRFVTLGKNANRPVFHRLERRHRKRRHLHEPLVGETRLDDGIAAIAVPYAVLVHLLVGEKTARGERLHDRIAGREAIHADELGRRAHGARGRVVAQMTLGRNYHRLREAMTFPDFEVVRIVRRRDLQRTRAERRIDVRIGDDRNQQIVQRMLHQCADERRVAFVVRMDRDRDVTRERFGARRRNRERARWIVGERIADVIERARFVVELRLFVR
jgi:hypothetical protein